MESVGSIIKQQPSKKKKIFSTKNFARINKLLSKRYIKIFNNSRRIL